MAKPKADWSQFRSGGEAYPLQRSRGDGDDDAEAAVVAMERSRNGYWKRNFNSNECIVQLNRISTCVLGKIILFYIRYTISHGITFIIE